MRDPSPQNPERSVRSFLPQHAHRVRLDRGGVVDRWKQRTRGLYFGDDHEVFFRAGRLAAQVNCFRIEQAPATVVVHMHPKKYERTWLANKAIYRTRMAVADGGKLIVIAPGGKELW